MTEFVIDKLVLPQALNAWNKSPKTFKSLAGMAEAFWGVSAEVFTAAFHNQRAQAQREAGFATLLDTVSKVNVTKGILNTLEIGQAWIVENTIQEVKDSAGVVTTKGFTPKLSWSIEYTPKSDEDSSGLAWNASAKLVCSIGAKRRGTRAVKEGDKKGRISAFVAWDKHGSKGENADTFQIEKVEGGYKVDGRIVAKGGLTKFLLSVHGDSKTIRKMKEYPEMKLGE